MLRRKLAKITLLFWGLVLFGILLYNVPWDVLAVFLIIVLGIASVIWALGVLDIP